jgi:hypothetical protein
VAEGDGVEQAIGAPSGAPGVFISYASQDAAVRVPLLWRSNAMGRSVGSRLKTPGAVYADAIVHALDASSPVIPTTSREIAASAE